MLELFLELLHANIYWLVNQINHLPNVNYRLKPETELELTLTGTAYTSAIVSSIILETTSIVLDGTKGHWIDLEHNGVFSEQVNAAQYL